MTLSSEFSMVLTPNTSISGHRGVVEMLSECFGNFEIFDFFMIFFEKNRNFPKSRP